MEQREMGVITFWDEKRGYGFIRRDFKRDIFVHYSQIKDVSGFVKLQIGQEVEFTIADGKKGKEAHDVTVLTIY